MPLKQGINSDSNLINIRGIMYSKLDPNVAIDYITGEWLLKNKAHKVASSIYATVVDGVAKINEYLYTMDYIAAESKQHTYFLRSILGNFYITKNYKNTGKGKLYPSIEEKNADWLLYDEITNKTLNNPKKFRSFDHTVSLFKDINNPEINDEDRKSILERDIEFGVRTITNKIFEGLNYTFGVELETNSGRVSDDEAKGLNLKCEFDGSLRDNPNQKKEEVLGGEYITGVLTGDSGMYQLSKICNLLSNNCTINTNCGVHVHIGNIVFTKDIIDYMYILGRLLENEIFSTMPKSRRGNSYCRPLKDLKLSTKELSCTTPILYEIVIDEYYNRIFREVSGGKMPDKRTNKLNNHPNGSKCGYNKDAQRYCWLNFVTAMFNTKNSINAYTLEFRIHYATLNYTKIKNWIKICFAFVNFAQNHQSSIKRGYWLNKNGDKFFINLSTIVKAAYPRTGRLVEEYIEDRKNRFLLDTGEIEALEYSKDKEGVTNLSIRECV